MKIFNGNTILALWLMLLDVSYRILENHYFKQLLRTFNQLLCLLNVPPSKRAMTVHEFCSDSSSEDLAVNMRATLATYLVRLEIMLYSINNLQNDY